MAIQDFYIGNTLKYNLTFTQESDGAVIPIVGWQIFLSFKYDLEDSDADAVIQKVFTMADNADTQAGIANLVLTSEDTDNFTEARTYHYGFKRVIPGSPPDVHTLETGKVRVKKPASDIVVEHAYVPSVINMVSATGQTTLTTAGFVIGTITTVASSTIDSGSIISTSPLTNEYVPLGSTINIIVAS